MFKFNSMRRIPLTLLCFVILFGIYSKTKSMEENVASYITKVYPTRAALTLCKNLSDTISINDDTTSKAYKILKDFNTATKNILICNKNIEKPTNDFHIIFSKVLITLKSISEDSSFSERTKHISFTIEPDLRKLYEKTKNLKDANVLKNLLQQEAPAIAVKEFLDRNINLRERSTKCDDCGLGYFRQLKNPRGKLTLECQLCHHHQNPDLKLSIVTFVQPTNNQESHIPGDKVEE